MPVLSHSLEHYAKLWQDACDRGHGSSLHTQEDTAPSCAQNPVHGSTLLASGCARPPTPPKPKSTRSESGSPPKLTKKTSPQPSKPRTKFSKDGLVWKKKESQD